MLSSTFFTRLFQRSTTPEIHSITDSLLIDSERHVAAIADTVVDALIERSRVPVSEDDHQSTSEKTENRGSRSIPEKIADAIIERLQKHDIDLGDYIALSQADKGTSDSTSQVAPDVHHPCNPKNGTRPFLDGTSNELSPNYAICEEANVIAEREDSQLENIKHISESHWILAPNFEAKLKVAVEQCHRVLFDSDRTEGLVEAYMATLESVKQSNGHVLDDGDQALAFAHELVHDHYFKLLTVTLAKCDDAVAIYTSGCKGKLRTAPDVRTVSINEMQRLRVHPGLRAHAYGMCQMAVWTDRSLDLGHGSGSRFWTGKRRLATQECDLIRILKHAGKHDGVRCTAMAAVAGKYQDVATECGDFDLASAFGWLYRTYESE